MEQEITFEQIEEHLEETGATKLKLFKDLPSTDTPLSATNLNLELSYIGAQFENVTDNINSLRNITNGLKGTILWTNPNPTSNFSPQTLNLDLSNYDEIEIIYRHYKTDATRLFTKVLIPSKQALVYPELDTSGGFIAIQSREFEVKNTGIVFESGYFKGARNIEQNDGRCIPLYVIGYKTGLFN